MADDILFVTAAAALTAAILIGVIVIDDIAKPHGRPTIEHPSHRFG